MSDTIVDETLTVGETRAHAAITEEAAAIPDDVSPEWFLLNELNKRMARMEADVNRLKNGVNTIGAMMNEVSQAFGQIMAQVQQGGLGSLLGGLMGGKRNG